MRPVVAALCAVAASCCFAACGDNEPPAPGGAEVEIDVPQSVTIDEGASTTFVVKLREDPGAPVTVDVTSLDSAKATVTPDHITLSSENYATGESVTVMAGHDVNVVEDATDIELTTERGASRALHLRILDGDVQAVMLGKVSLSLVESTTGELTVWLARQPSVSETVTLTTSDAAVATVEPATLTFTPADYATAQTVIVTAVADDDVEPGLAHIAATAPDAIDDGVSIDVADDDVQALVVTAPPASLGEGHDVTFDVSLAFKPTTTITVAVDSSDPTALSVTSPANLTFDPSNYNVPQSVTLSAPLDADALDENVSVTLDGGPALTTTAHVRVVDNDDIQVASSLLIWEGTSEMLTVKLANDPGPSGRIVSVQVLGGDAAVTPSTLAFTSANFSTGLQVQVDGVVDETSTTDKHATLQLSSADQTDRQVAVTIEQAIPGAIRFPGVTLSNPYAGGTGSLRLDFSTSNPWPGDGKLVLAIGPPYDVSTATLEASSLDGQLSVTATPSTLTLTRSNGTAIPNSTPIWVRFGNVRNPPYAGGASVQIQTRTGTGGLLDTGSTFMGASAAPMTEVTRTLSTTSPGATGDLTISFRTVNEWPASGWVQLSFPWSLDVAMSTLSAQSGVDGAFTFAYEQYYNRITLRRSGGSMVPAGTLVSLTFSNVANSATPQSSAGIAVLTMTSTAQWIDTATTPDITIGCPTSITKSPGHLTNVSRGKQPWFLQPQFNGGMITELQASDYLVADGFGFALPAGATITGIEVSCEHEPASASVIDDGIRVVKASSIGQVDRSRASLWAPGEIVVYGGTSDLWGDTWSVADIESGTFGVALAAKTTVPPPAHSQPEIHYVKVTAHLSCR